MPSLVANRNSPALHVPRKDQIMKREDIGRANKLLAKIEQAEDILEAISDPERRIRNSRARPMESRH